MARKKKAPAAENTEGWLTTYADLVSLLLCFFVLMYTASTPDEAKMQWILRSMSDLSGDVVNPVTADQVEDSTDGVEENEGPDKADVQDGDVIGIEGNLPLTFDDLFNWVSTAISDAELDTSVSAEMADGKLLIRFNDDIMFDADSFDLLPAGRDALNIIAPGISAINDYIESVQVAGHTAPTSGTGGVNDWFLSGMRSVSVLNHLDFGRRMVESDKFEFSGYGQYKPHYSTVTMAENARNRRVELVITRNDYQPEFTSVVMDTLEFDYRLGPIPGGSRKPTPAELDRQKQIEEAIRERYGNIEIPEAQAPENEFGPSIPKLPTIDADGNVIGIVSGGDDEESGADAADAMAGAGDFAQ